MDLVQMDRGLTDQASGDDSKSTCVGFILLRGNMLDVHNVDACSHVPPVLAS